MVNNMAGPTWASRWSQKNYDQHLITHITCIIVFVVITQRNREAY